MDREHFFKNIVRFFLSYKMTHQSVYFLRKKYVSPMSRIENIYSVLRANRNEKICAVKINTGLNYFFFGLKNRFPDSHTTTSMPSFHSAGCRIADARTLRWWARLV